MLFVERARMRSRVDGVVWLWSSYSGQGFCAWTNVVGKEFGNRILDTIGLSWIHFLQWTMISSDYTRHVFETVAALESAYVHCTIESTS